MEVVDIEIPSLKRPRQELMGEQNIKESQDWYVIIKVDPFARVPFGEPDPEEQPLRHPHVMPAYHLELVPKSMVKSVQFLITAIPIAKITNTYNQGTQLDENYIPPCTSINSYPLLFDQYKLYEKTIQHLDGNLFEIIKKIQQKKSNNEANTLTHDIEGISNTALDYINANIDHYRMILSQYPPVYVLSWFKGLARSIKSNMRFLLNKESMLSYFNRYISNVEERSFDVVIQQLCDIQYNHLEIRESFDAIDRFLFFMDNLFKELVRLDFQEFASPNIINSQVIRTPGSVETPRPTNTNSGGGIVIRDSQRKKRGATGLGDMLD